MHPHSSTLTLCTTHWIAYLHCRLSKFKWYILTLATFCSIRCAAWSSLSCVSDTHEHQPFLQQSPGVAWPSLFTWLQNFLGAPASPARHVACGPLAPHSQAAPCTCALRSILSCQICGLCGKNSTILLDCVAPWFSVADFCDNLCKRNKACAELWCRGLLSQYPQKHRGDNKQGLLP